MTDPVTPETTAPLPLISRIIGVITSPRATFQNIVAAPRPVGVLFIVATVIGIGSLAPQLTEKGRQASVEMQTKVIERMGQPVTPEMQARIEEGSRSPVRKVVSLVGTYIVIPIFALIFAGIYWAAFNTIMGGTASFKQVLAIVTHSQVIGALGMLAALPIMMSTGKMTMAGPFNLGALVPMLEEGSTLVSFLSSISVFSLWAFFVTGIGLGVLYKRNSTTIALTIIAVYLVFMFAVASMFGKFFGAS
jgi:hypothetical protein